MDSVIESCDHEGFTIELHYDTFAPDSPRQDRDNAGTLLTWTRRYESPDPNSFDHPNHFLDWAEDEDIPLILPVYKYEHSGVAYKIGDGGNPFAAFDPGGWDSGAVGVIYMDADTIEREFSGDMERAKDCLHAEMSEYSAWANGEVYGFVVKDAEDEVIESVWGFLGQEGFDYMKEEAKRIAEFHAELYRTEEEKLEEFFSTVWAD